MSSELVNSGSNKQVLNQKNCWHIDITNYHNCHSHRVMSQNIISHSSHYYSLAIVICWFHWKITVTSTLWRITGWRYNEVNLWFSVIVIWRLYYQVTMNIELWRVIKWCINKSHDDSQVTNISALYCEITAGVGLILMSLWDSQLSLWLHSGASKWLYNESHKAL